MAQRPKDAIGLIAKYLAPREPDDLSSVGVLHALSNGIGERGTDLANRVRARLSAAIRNAGPSHFGVPPGYCFGPPAGPAGFDAAQMVALAKRHGDLAAKQRPSDLGWFKARVQNKGPWDYKQRDRELQGYGNYHYGYVGTRQGIAEPILRAGAGYAQLKAGTSRPSFLTSVFDDPADQEQIMRGASDARNGCY